MSMPTNKVDIQFNYDNINQDFYVYQILADSLKDEGYKHTVMAVYDTIKPLSLIKPKASAGRFLVLCHEQKKVRESYPNFTLQQVHTLTDLHPHDLARLLIQAIPCLKQLDYPPSELESKPKVIKSEVAEPPSF